VRVVRVGPRRAIRAPLFGEAAVAVPDPFGAVAQRVDEGDEAIGVVPLHPRLRADRIDDRGAPPAHVVLEGGLAPLGVDDAHELAAHVVLIARGEGAVGVGEVDGCDEAVLGVVEEVGAAGAGFSATGILFWRVRRFDHDLRRPVAGFVVLEAHLVAGGVDHAVDAAAGVHLGDRGATEGVELGDPAGGVVVDRGGHHVGGAGGIASVGRDLQRLGEELPDLAHEAAGLIELAHGPSEQ
jgi:hypothetical protein